MNSLLCGKKFTSLFIFLVAVASVAYAQNGGVKGSVHTSDGKPAEFVTITLQGTTKGTTVNKNGTYTLNNLTPGSYTVIASFTGLVTQTR
jgi:iron complex outermembrane receptor protein